MRTIWTGVIEQTPLGPIGVGVTDRGLALVEFRYSPETFDARLRKLGFSERIPEPARTAEPIRQIAEFLEGQRQTFEVAIDWEGMGPFQEVVLRETFNIPYGQTLTYGDIARKIGKPGAARAVGRAEATNPIPLVIPCHRVVGADGGLHGYGGPGGIPTKAWLLRLEKQV